MFDFIRTHQRLMQLVLLVLILPSFVLIGVSGYTTYVSGDDELVTMSGSAITTQEFDQARRAQLDQFQRQMGSAFDPSLLDTEPARRNLLESLIDRRVVADVATAQRFTVSDSALRQSIAAMPEFQVDGQFSPERYNELLAMSGLNSKSFEQGRRAELALDRVLTPVGQTATLPAPIVTLLRDTLAAERTVRLRLFRAADYRADIQPSQADIEAWYQKNQAEFSLPESVDIQYVVLDEAAAMQNLPAVSEDELKRYYEQNKARYVQGARVNLSHILISLPAGADQATRDKARAQAQSIADQVAGAPDTFAEAARAQSQDAGTARNGGSLGWISKGLWPQNIESVVFALPKGGVSGVVEGPDGLHVFRADDVQPEQGETFEQARDKVQDEVRRQLGAERFADMAGKLTSLVYDNPDSLEPVAAGLGLTIRSANGIARDSLLSADDVGADAAIASADAATLGDVRVRRVLFSSDVLTERHNSGVIEISPDTMIVVRVAKLQPANMLPLDKVKDRVQARLVDEQATAAARAAGGKALADYQPGSADAAVPDTFGPAIDISRVQTSGVDKALFDTIFQAPANALPAFVGADLPDGYAIARIERVSAGSEPVLAFLSGLSTELSSAWGSLEQQAVMGALRRQENVKILPEAEGVLKGEADATP